MLASWTASLTWCSRHLGPVLETENLIARGSLKYSGCLLLRWAAMMLVSWLALMSALCELILVWAPDLVSPFYWLPHTVHSPV